MVDIKQEPKRYRKKPVVIEAMRFELFAEDGDAICPRGSLKSAQEIQAWSSGKAFPAHYHERDGWAARLSVITLEGAMQAEPGDWIIRGIKGEFYPCKPDIFEATYEQASS